MAIPLITIMKGFYCSKFGWTWRAFTFARQTYCPKTPHSLNRKYYNNNCDGSVSVKCMAIPYKHANVPFYCSGDVWDKTRGTIFYHQTILDLATQIVVIFTGRLEDATSTCLEVLAWRDRANLWRILVKTIHFELFVWYKYLFSNKLCLISVTTLTKWTTPNKTTTKHFTNPLS